MGSDQSKPIVYIGAERVGKAVLLELLNAGKNIRAVFTAHPSLREGIADFEDFSDIEQKFPDVDFHYIYDSKDAEVCAKIKSYKPEAIFVISWSQIIPQEILDIAPEGVAGLHYSMLPERRGGAPLNWAIIDGLKEFGITLFYLTDKIDAGDIIVQQRIAIDDEDTVRDLLDKIEKLAPKMVLEQTDAIVNGTASRTKQDEEKATYTRRRTPQDSMIDPSWSLDKIFSFIKALAPPYPAAFIKDKDKTIRITAAKRIDKNQLEIEGVVTQNEN